MAINKILLSGVGGQGTILAAKILSNGLLYAGYNVKMSEIHGMSQRGGSVTSHIVYSKDEVYAPVIDKGEADILVAFEEMEANRWIEYLKIGGKVVINDYQIMSIPILVGAFEYPEGIKEYIKENVKDCIIYDAAKIAREIGNEKVMNMVLLGSLIKAMNLEHISWEKVIKDNVKEQFADINIKALKRGMELI
ncbi:MAG: indolepyruvate oxidoreductase subunit beta [Eubacteriaceae bacterium]